MLPECSEYSGCGCKCGKRKGQKEYVILVYVCGTQGQTLCTLPALGLGKCILILQTSILKTQS